MLPTLDLRLLSRVPRVPGLGVAVASTRSATWWCRSPLDRAPRAAAVLRAQHRRLHGHGPLAAAAEAPGRGRDPHAVHRRHRGRQGGRGRRARAEDGHARRRDRDLDDALHGAGLRAHGEGGGGRDDGAIGPAHARRGQRDRAVSAGVFRATDGTRRPTDRGGLRRSSSAWQDGHVGRRDFRSRGQGARAAPADNADAEGGGLPLRAGRGVAERPGRAPDRPRLVARLPPAPPGPR